MIGIPRYTTKPKKAHPRISSLLLRRNRRGMFAFSPEERCGGRRREPLWKGGTMCLLSVAVSWGAPSHGSCPGTECARHCSTGRGMWVSARAAGTAGFSTRASITRLVRFVPGSRWRETDACMPSVGICASNAVPSANSPWLRMRKIRQRLPVSSNRAPPTVFRVSGFSGRRRCGVFSPAWRGFERSTLLPAASSLPMRLRLRSLKTP